MPKTEFGYYISLGICYCYLVAKSCPTLLQPHGLCLSGFSVHGFPRQEHWSRLPFPSPGDLPNPGIKSKSSVWQADSSPLSYLGSPKSLVKTANYFMYHFMQRAIRILTKAINTLTRVKSGTTSITVD